MNRSLADFARFLTRHWSLLLAMSVGSGLAHVATTGMPLQVGALMDGTTRTAGEAGLFAFVEVAALSVGMILISLWKAPLRPSRVAMIGALLAAVADLGLFAVRDFRLQLVLGTMGGLGFGWVYSATIAGGASSADSDRAYAIGFGGALLLVVLIMAILPFTASRFGVLGVFACLAVFALLCTPLFRGFKPAATVAGDRSGLGRSPAWRTPGAPGLLFSWAAFSTGTAAVYVFAERIGNSIHLAPTDTGLILSSGVFMGVVGTLVAGIYSRRFNRRVALISGLVGSGLSCFLMGHAATLIMFAAGVYLFWIFTMFLYCFLLGSAALLDNSGRLGTLGSGTERLGYAVGAWIGGLFAEHVSYAATGTFACAACLMGIVIGYPSLFRALGRHLRFPSEVASG